jgi:hypothetical protein
MTPVLIAVIQTNRSDIEYLARNRQDIIDTFDWLRLAEGDAITVTMRYLDSEELDGLTETTADEIAEYEGYDEQQIEG